VSVKSDSVDCSRSSSTKCQLLALQQLSTPNTIIRWIIIGKLGDKSVGSVLLQLVDDVAPAKLTLSTDERAGVDGRAAGGAQLGWEFEPAGQSQQSNTLRS
jgi:hypothetical protein